MNNILNSLKKISSAVMYALEAGELEQVLERIAHISCDLVSARYAALGVPDGEGGLKYFKVAGMSPEEVGRMAHLPTGKGLIGVIMETRTPIRLEKMQDDSRAVGFCAGHPHMTSLLGVPIQVGQQLFGVLYLCDRLDGLPFTEEDEWLIETMAGYAALAIAGSQLSEQQNRLTVLEERERIGMELHDGVIQSLYALGMHLDLVRSSGEIKADDLQPAINGLNDVIEDIRRYIQNLKSTNRQHYSFRDSFKKMTAHLHIPDTVQIEIDAPEGPPPFTPATFESLCLISNEVLSNAARHSNASRIKIIARQINHHYEITISDNGQGFNLKSAAKQNGLGLRNIQQRARLHGGKVEIKTAPGEGTTLTITIPV